MDHDLILEKEKILLKGDYLKTNIIKLIFRIQYLMAVMSAALLVRTAVMSAALMVALM